MTQRPSVEFSRRSLVSHWNTPLLFFFNMPYGSGVDWTLSDGTVQKSSLSTLYLYYKDPLPLRSHLLFSMQRYIDCRTRWPCLPFPLLFGPKELPIWASLLLRSPFPIAPNTMRPCQLVGLSCHTRLYYGLEFIFGHGVASLVWCVAIFRFHNNVTWMLNRLHWVLVYAGIFCEYIVKIIPIRCRFLSITCIARPLFAYLFNLSYEDTTSKDIFRIYLTFR